MTGLSRRSFLAASASLAGAFVVAPSWLGEALSAPLKPSDAPTTLLQTIRFGPAIRNKYLSLVPNPGESYIARTDITKKDPTKARATARRSLAYFGHFSDIHVIDSQTPGRLEATVEFGPTAALATRPQETLSVHVQAAMVEAVAKARFSPLTGAPMMAVLNTGDASDSLDSLEIDWYIKILDGQSATPNSGEVGVYDGVQVWDEATYCWHPDNADLTEYGAFGFPTIPGLLDAAVGTDVESVGLPAPWYTVFGNHDTMFMGNMPSTPSLESWVVGDRKAATLPATLRHMASPYSADTNALSQFVDQTQEKLGIQSGVRTVAPDENRRLFDNYSFMKAHLESPALPGPVGHGFTPKHLESGQTWWRADASPYLRVFGLNSCNQVIGNEGAIPQDQFDWLESELAKAQEEDVLAVVISHHNSYTLSNPAEPAIGPSQKLIHSEEFVAMLHRYPNMIAWVNGHTHINTITAHPTKEGGGFWEVTTASCIDFPQQQQLLEVVDNRDGTLSIFATTMDHDSGAAWTPGDLSQKGLASLSRQLSANYWPTDPPTHLGSPLDRNTELLLPAPFDLAKIKESTVETSQAASRAQILAYEKGAGA